MKRSRLKSPVLWGAVAALFMLALKIMGFDAAFDMATPRAQAIFDALCTLMAVLGIVNNPTDPKSL